jgi:UDP-GlcNAc:undecaprenyl-phosphate/decaprenyl-phosphate GlcNAc-1-phosphate transferase
VTLYESYAIVVAFAIGATFVLTYPVRWIASRVGAVDQPGEHRMHAHPTPVVGGAAMLLAFCGSIELASRLSPLSGIFASSSEPLGVVLAAAVIYLVGLIDDVRDISAPAKVAGQVLAAMILVFLGVTMYYFKIPFEASPITLSPEILPLITAVWVVGMANAVNLIDGLDGLAAGIVGIASAALCIYGLRLVHLGDLGANNVGPLIAAATFGVCIGFLPHNFHPAKIFMGDGGALFLGLAMAASTMVIGGRTETVATFTDVPGLTFFRFAPLFIPFFILGVPILDTAFAIVRRSARRTNFAERDLGHLHHRLVRLGHGHRRAVLILWAWTALLSAFVLVPTFAPQANAYVPIGLAALAVGLYTVFRPAGRPLQNGRGRHPLYEDPAGTADEAETSVDDSDALVDTEAPSDTAAGAEVEFPPAEPRSMPEPGPGELDVVAFRTRARLDGDDVTAPPRVRPVLGP